jgi:hypothetical protein
VGASNESCMKENSKINAGWHKLHQMPDNATIDQRIEWHLQHLQHCQCRADLPEKLKEEMKKRGIVMPATEKRGEMLHATA